MISSKTIAENAKLSAPPSVRIVPDSIVWTDGDDAAKLCSHYWFDPDDWQIEVLRCWLGRTALGRLAIMLAGLTCPRQNGKNAIIEALELYLLLTDKDTHILHTAHQVRTSKRAFNRLARIFEDKRFPELKEAVKFIRRTNGEEAIVLKSGASIEYVSRSRSGGRGFDAITLVVYDEAQELTDDQVEALMATLSASPTGDRQIIYAGTPPAPGCVGSVFRRTREKALTDPGRHTSWHEWSIEELPDQDVSFDDLVPMIEATNPAMGTRLDLAFTEEEFSAMSLDGFARERLGWWSKATSSKLEPVISVDEWAACATETPPDGTADGFGIKFSPDGTEVAIAASIKYGEKYHVELVDRRSTSRGTKWIADFIRQRAERSVFAVDGRSGAQALIDRVADDVPYGSVVQPKVSDVISAAAGLLTAVQEGELSWYQPEGAPQDQLTQSAITSCRRAVGSYGGWAFGGENSTPVEAAAFAIWAASKKYDFADEMEVYF